MKLKLKPEYKDSHLMRGSTSFYTKDILPEHYEVYYKKYPFLFDVIEEKQDKNIISTSEENTNKYINKKNEKPNIRNNK